MSAVPNRRIVLAQRPRGTADLSCFRLESVTLAPPREGENLLRTLWLSLDPYMRGRMSDAPSYAPPVAIGAVMTGQTVSVVAASRHPRWRTGDLVLANSGWQEYEVTNAGGIVALSPDIDPPSHALGVLGMPGFTAFVGLLDIGKPQPGETLVVAAATGGVGSVVGQIAKLKGCRVVGIAGGPDKCRWAVGELGFDECIDHRSGALEAQLTDACPRGIDIYYENVGGKVFRSVLPLLNAHARIPVCGLISQYNETVDPAQRPTVPQLMRAVLVKRIVLRGFIISDGHERRRADFLQSMLGWLRAGKMKYREDIVRGIENAPEAFLGLLEGRNFGKLVVAMGNVGEQDP